MRARDIMTTDPVTVTADTPVKEAAAILAEHAISSMPVVDEDGAVIGMLSELDVIRDRVPHDPRASVVMRADRPDPPDTVAEIMSPIAICLPDITDVADVAATLLEYRMRAVPIVSGAGLVGIVSRRDIMRSLLRDDTGIAAEVRQRLQEYRPEVAWRVAVDAGVVTVTAPHADDRQRRSVEGLLHTVPGVVRVHTRASG